MHHTFIFTVLWSFFFVTSQAMAAPDPVVQCQIAKLNAAKVRESCLVNERKKELQGKAFGRQTCEDKFDKALAKADKNAAKKGISCRFIDNGDGTISDLDTLLMWEKKDSNDDWVNTTNIHDVDWLFTFASQFSSGGNYIGPNGEVFIPFLASLNGLLFGSNRNGFAGYHDWHVPTCEELQTIRLEPCMETPCTYPAFNNGVDSFTKAPFNHNGFNNGYWCVDPDNSPYALRLCFNPQASPCSPSIQDANYVRAVRGGRH